MVRNTVDLRDACMVKDELLARLRAENAALKQQNATLLQVKVSVLTMKPPGVLASTVVHVNMSHVMLFMLQSNLRTM